MHMPRTSLSLFTLLPVLLTFLDAFSVLNLLDGAIRQVARHQEGNCHGTLRLMIHHNTSGTFDSLHHDNSQFFDKFFLCKANNFPFGFKLNFFPIEEKLAFPCSTIPSPDAIVQPIL